VGQIGYWPGFSSTTKERAVALNFTIGRSTQGQQLVFMFEIFVSGKNSPPTNIELPASWSNYPGEQEVLLLPFFCFIVAGNRKVKVNGHNVVIVTLVELPRQNLLEIRPMILTRLIWLDPFMASDENRFYA